MRIQLLLFLFVCSISYGQRPDLSKVPGAVIAHSPKSSGKYIGSPSLTILPNGQYVASHDFFGPESNEHVRATSLIYRSKNKGRSWKKVAEIDGAFWSKLFVHQGKLYFLGTDRHHGNTIIRRSDNGGKDWTEPTDRNSGLLLEGEYHCAPGPAIIHDGRLWRGMESAMGEIKEWGKRYGTFMMSIPINADLLKSENWTFSNILYHNPSYLKGGFGGWIEGNAVVNPRGEMWNILRVANDDISAEEKAAIVKVSSDGKVSSFDPETGFIPFDGGSKKFPIRYDQESERYWTIANIIPKEVRAAHPKRKTSGIRNTQALLSSKDLIRWDLDQVLLQHPDVEYHGFQYVDWQFDGADIIFLSRTAHDDGLGGAHNNHDANLLTFHRIENFRNKSK
ncbi:MAG: exo-alpha-sialidase [Saprospiraceae bacterium]|nr:exo-alpha-sialidase [Saprospiraceae bacterium]